MVEGIFQPNRVKLFTVALLFIFATVFGSVPVKVSAFADGDGSEETPYRIEDCTDLQSMDDDLDAYYVLTQDIDCSETTTWNSGAGFLPIGSWDNPFLGELDGDSHVISNLFIDTTVGENNPGGLFDRVGQYDNQVGLIKDVGLENIDVKGGWSTGGLVGVLYGQTNNTYTTGAVEGSGEVGGLVGSHGGIWDTVINSWSSANVTGTQDTVGGLVGYNSNDSNIINSYATGEVSGGDDYVGGLVGVNDGNIENSHATGSVYGDDQSIGGLVGRSSGGMITKSYASGHVYGVGTYVGGLVGRNNAEITKSYSDNTLGSDENVGVWSGCEVGGLVGRNDSVAVINNSYSRSTSHSATLCSAGGFIGHNEGQIYQTYSTGQTVGDVAYQGGFIGNAFSGSLSVSFWDPAISSLSNACGSGSLYDCDEVLRVAGPTTAELKDIAQYGPDVLSEGAWDFTETWAFISGQNDDYPVLQNVGATPVDWPDPEEEQDSQDLNGDEIPDSEQPNVGGYVSTITGKIVAIDVGEECELTTDDTTTESNFAVQDAAFDYDNGLWDFEADCGTPGYTTTVKLYYYNVAPTGLVLRKHNPTTNAYFTINDASIATQTINDSPVTVVTYQVTDGGLRDVDGIADGMINDPAGLARSIVGAPNTGLLRK